MGAYEVGGTQWKCKIQFSKNDVKLESFLMLLENKKPFVEQLQNMP